MLPRWHIFFGAVFSILIFLIVPETKISFILLFFLASFLIDFDHYLVAVMKNKKLSLKHAFDYHKIAGLHEEADILRNIRRRSDFHLFHTVEFHALVGAIGIAFLPFFYIFLGMIFHSLLDVISLAYEGKMHRREFFFFNWARKNNKF